MATGQFTPCDLHFPHKEWNDDPLERENYLAVERWAYHFRTGCPGNETIVMIGRTTPCDLHIPHKDWAGDNRERENYLEMERWAYYFRKNCCAGGVSGGGLEAPPILITETRQTDYATPGIQPAASFEDNVRFNQAPSLISAGITFDTPVGSGIPVDPYGYTSAYYGDAVHFSFPAATNVHVHVKFYFSEINSVPPYSLEPVTRGLHLRITTAAGDFANEYKTFTGTRLGPINAQIDGGPYNLTTPFTLHVYCQWNSVHAAGFGQHNANIYTGSDGLVVTGVL